jgi:hypothetical protein
MKDLVKTFCAAHQVKGVSVRGKAGWACGPGKVAEHARYRCGWPDVLMVQG